MLKEFPNRMLVATSLCVFSAVQSLVVAVAAVRDFSRWRLRPDVSLLAVVYAVILILVFRPFIARLVWDCFGGFIATHFNSYAFVWERKRNQ